jgi:hypothetical protein
VYNEVPKPSVASSPTNIPTFYRLYSSRLYTPRLTVALPKVRVALPKLTVSIPELKVSIPKQKILEKYNTNEKIITLKSIQYAKFKTIPK